MSPTEAVKSVLNPRTHHLRIIEMARIISFTGARNTAACCTGAAHVEAVLSLSAGRHFGGDRAYWRMASIYETRKLNVTGCAAGLHPPPRVAACAHRAFKAVYRQCRRLVGGGGTMADIASIRRRVDDMRAGDTCEAVRVQARRMRRYLICGTERRELARLCANASKARPSSSCNLGRSVIFCARDRESMSSWHGH